MTQITNEQKQQLEAAAMSVMAKLERFQEGLSPEERFTLSAALWAAGVEQRGATGDVAGHSYAIERAAKAYVDSLPIWGSLRGLVADISRPINWPK